MDYSGHKCLCIYNSAGNRNVFIVLLFYFVLACGSAPGQPIPPVQNRSAANENSDINLYYHWLEQEQRDSVYFKADRDYKKNGGGKNKSDWLGGHVSDKSLLKNYFAIAGTAGDTALISGFGKQTNLQEKSPRKSDQLLEFAGKAAKKSESVLELAALSAAFTEAFWTEQDYDKAFYIGFRLEEKLPQACECEYPDKRRDYFKLGEAYYLFLDNYKSIKLLEKALNPTPSSFTDRTNLDALKIIGICYANIKQWQQSDNYFRATLQSDNIVLNRPIYNAYALSHLGCNAMLTGRYDLALRLSSTVWPVLRRTNDYGHLAGMCYCRGTSYLRTGKLKQASVWVDSLIYFAHKDQYNQSKRIKQAYQLQADYYTVMGDARRAKIYYDSLEGVYKKEEELNTSQYIARAAQRYDSEKIEAQATALYVSRERILIISVIALLSITAVLTIAYLYRKRNAAYKVLAQKAGEWAGEEAARAKAAAESDIETENTEDAPTNADRRIMSLAEKEMIEKQAYREPGLTMELFADRLGVRRHLLSRAINRVTGNNFNHYINSYRIKEAVRLISQNEQKDLYMDELYERIGFNNRTSFYRTFKQFTGISPLEFQKTTKKKA